MVLIPITSIVQIDIYVHSPCRRKDLRRISGITPFEFNNGAAGGLSKSHDRYMISSGTRLNAKSYYGDPRNQYRKKLTAFAEIYWRE
jgi:hypothetical protein